MTKTRLSIKFGAFAAQLEDQLIAQGLVFNKKLLAHQQKDADALTRLMIRGVLAESEVRRGRQKLLKKINDISGKHVEK